MVFQEIRLVALIIPATSWGIKVNPDERVKIAERGQPCEYAFCHVGPMRDEPEKRIFSGLVTWPEHNTLEKWSIFIHTISIAKMKPPLYQEDFSNDIEVFIDFNYLT